MNFVLQWRAWQIKPLFLLKTQANAYKVGLKNVTVCCVSSNRAPTCVWGDFLRLWKMSLFFKLKRTRLNITSAASLKLSSWKIKIFAEIDELLRRQTCRLKKEFQGENKEVMSQMNYHTSEVGCGGWREGRGRQQPADWPVSCFEKGCRNAKSTLQFRKVTRPFNRTETV